jgi:hydrogenase maturation protease
LVLCVGNPDRGDDGAGRLVAALLRGRVPADVVVAECDGGAAGVIEAFSGVDCVFVIDAAVSGASAGTIHRVDCAAGEALPAGRAASSHGLGVAEAIALARMLGCLPRQCVVYAIEGARFDVGADVSPAVADAAREVAEGVLLSCPSVIASWPPAGGVRPALGETAAPCHCEAAWPKQSCS